MNRSLMDKIWFAEIKQNDCIREKGKLWMGLFFQAIIFINQTFSSNDDVDKGVRMFWKNVTLVSVKVVL